VVSETLLMLRPIIEGKHCAWKVDFPTTPVPVKADLTRSRSFMST